MENNEDTLDSDLFDDKDLKSGEGEEEKDTESLPMIWIILGVMGILIGLRGYYVYTQSRMFIIMIPNVQYLRDIVFGLLSFWIGKMLLTQKKGIEKWIYAYPIWVIGFILFSTMITSIQFNTFDPGWFITIDYLYIILSSYTINQLHKQDEISKSGVLHFFRTNNSFLVTGLFLLLALIWGLSIVFPYEFFRQFR